MDNKQITNAIIIASVALVLSVTGIIFTFIYNRNYQVKSVAGKEGTVTLSLSEDITDVDISSVLDNDILQYNTSSSLWVNKKLNLSNLNNLETKTRNISLTETDSTKTTINQILECSLIDTKNGSIVNVSNPINPQDVSTKDYTDKLINGLRVSASIQSGETITTQHVVNVTTPGSITLPDRASNEGKQYIVINNSSGTVTVNRAGSDLIDNDLTLVPLSVRHDRLVVIASSINWYTI
jgi:hypothetical protein